MFDKEIVSDMDVKGFKDKVLTEGEIEQLKEKLSTPLLDAQSESPVTRDGKILTAIWWGSGLVFAVSLIGFINCLLLGDMSVGSLFFGLAGWSFVSWVMLTAKIYSVDGFVDRGLLEKVPLETFMFELGNSGGDKLEMMEVIKKTVQKEPGRGVLKLDLALVEAELEKGRSGLVTKNPTLYFKQEN